MSPEQTAKQYQERKERFENEAKRLKSKYTKFSFVRLIVFFAGLIPSLIIAAKFAWFIGIFVFLLFLVGFYHFVKWHMAIQASQVHHENLYEVNKNELATQNHDYSAYSNGEAFMDPQHPYTIDMDIFGAYSFYQYINRTTTAIGSRKLADYLSNAVSKAEVKSRQAAIKELAPKLDWRQDLNAIGLGTYDELRFILVLQEWLEQENVIFGKKKFTLALIFVPIISVLGIIAAIFWLPWQILFLTFLPALYFLKITKDSIDKIAHQTDSVNKILYNYSMLIAHIEKHTFESEKLQELTKGLQKTTDHKGASIEIKRLSYVIGQVNVRSNVFVIILNLLGLWDIFWVRKLEQWKVENKNRLSAWFESLAEIETLSSFGNLYYNNQDWVFPSIVEDAELNGKQLGHPLLHRSKRVCNDFNIPTNGHIKLVTGSNMAGKSTFLRTVGMNIVLASIGAPVCAQEMKTPLLQVYSSMRTQDALHESTSSFYAELKRLKFIIEAVNAGENIFFLLDEILKGTNSKDRHTGSKALIKQLINSKGAGIIATHDLELGSLEESYGGAIENLCMEVRVENGELFFDYTLDKGVSKSFNATILMRNMGIEISEDL